MKRDNGSNIALVLERLCFMSIVEIYILKTIQGVIFELRVKLRGYYYRPSYSFEATTKVYCNESVVMSQQQKL